MVEPSQDAREGIARASVRAYHAHASGTDVDSAVSSRFRPRFQVPRDAQVMIIALRAAQVPVITHAIPSTPVPVQSGTQNAQRHSQHRDRLKMIEQRPRVPRVLHRLGHDHL
jgi:hypothetical protein